MPLVIRIPKEEEIIINGVTLRAVSNCALSIDDYRFKFEQQTQDAPRKITPAERG